MALNPLFVQDTLPTTSAAAIREFNDRYLAAIGASRPTGWADTLGEMIPTDRPESTFPISQLRTLYRRTEGQSRFKKLREASFDVKTEEFDDGYEARLMDLFLKVFAYRNWQQAPARLVLAEEQFRHLSIANLLVNGTSGTCVDGTAFFGSSHPINMTDPTVYLSGSTSTFTWSNYNSSATNVLGSTATGHTGGTHSLDNLQNEVTSMQTTVPDENGVLLGADPDTILVAQDYYEPLKNMLARERVLEFVVGGTGALSTNTNPVAGAATDNFYKGRFNVVPVKEWSIASGTTADWYLIDSKMVKAGISPWLALRQTVPASLALRVYDESTDYFRDTGNIKMSSHIWYGFSLVLPHAIRRVKGPTR
jgi:hypothetical protein